MIPSIIEESIEENSITDANSTFRLSESSITTPEIELVWAIPMIENCKKNKKVKSDFIILNDKVNFLSFTNYSRLLFHELM